MRALAETAPRALPVSSVNHPNAFSSRRWFTILWVLPVDSHAPHLAMASFVPSL